ncbi:hypothetical protein PRZ48_008602 [Zasmidium cellare]|uniref:Uncharacterized protein n=1 Tax=Zasmidium cellare TaxID=395010 RepID=A0ABR0EH14_ZASCE|nr:hypothetical protein PRZ48_008602 [Zasmidium cellare]
MPEDFTPFAKRQESTCGGNANLNPSALCCPAGQDCAAINTVQCDQGKQNATTQPDSQLHSEPTVELETCGNACCPMGYKCQGGVCLAQSKAEVAASSSSSSSASSSLLPTSTNSPLSTTTTTSGGTTITPIPLGGAVENTHDPDAFSGKSFAAGFVPGIALGAIIAAALVLCILRRRRRNSKSYIDEKHYSTGRDTLTDLGPDVYRRPTVHGRSISEPTVDMSLGHRTDFLHSSPPRDEEHGGYGGLRGYAVHIQSPAKAPVTPGSQAQEAVPRSKGWLSRSPFMNQAQTPVPTQSPMPAHLKRGTLHFQISPVRALRKQRSMHSLRRQMTDATTRSNSARRHRPDISRTGSTETIKVLMDTPDVSRNQLPRTLPSATYQPQPRPLQSASTWQTTTSSDDSTPIDEQPTQDDYTPTRPGRNSHVANVGGTLQSPYTPSNYPNADQHERDRQKLNGLLPPGMAGDRDSAWRYTAMTTFSSMMERAGLRKSYLGEEKGKGKAMKEKDLVMGPDPRNLSILLSSNSTPEVNAKPILESTYTKYLGKGCKLYSMLKQETPAPPTSYLSSQDLRDWGWQTKRDHSDRRVNELIGSFAPALQELGLGVTGADNVDLQVTHEGPISKGGQYKPTQAKYHELYNPMQGAIIAYRNYGPAKYASLDKGWGDAPLPGLKQWSDVVYLSWADITTPEERRGLKYVVRSSVQNQDTLDVVERALKKSGISSGRAPAWPGYTFKPEGRDLRPFQAVLGTPNASGVAWLLAQHREDLGNKTITAIRVWDKSGLENQDAGILLGMVVYIEDL